MKKNTTEFTKQSLATLKDEMLYDLGLQQFGTDLAGKSKGEMIKKILSLQEAQNKAAVVKQEPEASVTVQKDSKEPKAKKEKEEKAPKVEVPKETVDAFCGRLREAIAAGKKVWVQGRAKNTPITSVSVLEKPHYQTGLPVRGIVVNIPDDKVTQETGMYYASVMHQYLKIEVEVEEPVAEVPVTTEEAVKS